MFSLSKDEINKYKRQLNISGWGEEIQKKLKNSNVLIAGAGGLGSPVLYYLAAAGIGNITLCDYDIVDITNLNRQILHGDNTIGKLKTDSAVNSIDMFNNSINITSINEKITTKNAEELITGHDIIVDCLDNFKSRHILNKFSVKKSIPMVHAGISEFQGQITFLSPPETGCLACYFPDKDKSNPPNVIGATAGIIGSMEASEVIKYLTGIGTTLKNRLFFWDGLNMSSEIINLKKNPKCKICS